MTLLFRRFVKPIALAATLAGSSVGAAFCGDAADLSKLLSLIRMVEAPAGYDDYFRGVSSPPPKALTSMTVGEVLAWQDRVDAASISEASGGYQILEDTLRDLMVRYGIEGSETFSPQLQDFLATRLLDQIGWGAYRRGEVSPMAFGDRLAGVWAGFPLLTGHRRGMSAYHGLASNRALIDADVVERALRDLSSLNLAHIEADRGKPRKPRVAPLQEQLDQGFAKSVVITWSADPFYQD